MKCSEMDYNAEIPFQKEIPAGYYDISNEIRDTSVNKHFTSEQVHIVEHNERVAAAEGRYSSVQSIDSGGFACCHDATKSTGEPNRRYNEAWKVESSCSCSE